MNRKMALTALGLILALPSVSYGSHSLDNDNNIPEIVAQKLPEIVNENLQQQTKSHLSEVYKNKFSLQIQDKSPDSVSVVEMSHAQKVDVLPKKRMLFLAGGGIRGVYEASLLAVMEEWLNYDVSQVDWQHLADRFDEVSGTSTGSLLAACLVHKAEGVQRNTAMDALNLYARNGVKIFDEQKKMVGGAYGSLYDNQGLDELLKIFFGDDTFKHTHKPLSVIGFNPATRKPVVFSTHPLTDPSLVPSRLHEFTIRTALGVSTAAPVFFPGREVMIDGKNVYLEDGGLIANQPSEVVMKETLARDGQFNKVFDYEAYALGTGFVKPSLRIHGGALSALQVLKSSFESQVELALECGLTRVRDPNSPLSFFAHLQPLVERDEMDDTSHGYIQYMIKKSLKLAQSSEVFRVVLERLGMNRPTDEQMKNVVKKIKWKLESVRYETVQYLLNHDVQAPKGQVGLEIEWVERKLLKMDEDAFSFYEHLHTQNMQVPMEKGEREKLLTAFLAKNQVAISKRSYFSMFRDLIKSNFVDTDETVVTELIPRALDFHERTREKVQTFGRPRNEFSVSTILETLIAADMNNAIRDMPMEADAMLSDFIQLCEDDGSKYKYPNHNGYTPHMALVFVKRKLHLFKEMLARNENVLSVEEKKQMIKILRNFEKILSEKAEEKQQGVLGSVKKLGRYVGLPGAVQNSRYFTLANVFQGYVTYLEHKYITKAHE